MQTMLYNFGLAVLRLLLPFMAFFNKKARLFYKGRKNILNNIEKSLSKNNASICWMHCASVGEFEQGLPVVELLKLQYPGLKVLVTFFSPSGYEGVNHPAIDYKFYLPYDTPLQAAQFVQLVQPLMALFIKYEFWYHHLAQLKKNNIPVFSVSSIFRPSQAFFKWYGGWHRRMLHNFTYFGVQDEDSLNLLKSMGITQAALTGDTRFDRVLKIKETPAQFNNIEEFAGNRKVFMVGSLRPEDDAVVLPFIKSCTNYAFIIVPHDITEGHIKAIKNKLPQAVRYSQYTGEQAGHILIIDAIGMLSRLYRLAHLAYVGGGFSDGIHNILEPAVYHIPVFFGNKKYKKYKEANDLIARKAAFAVSSSQELATLVTHTEQNYTQVSKQVAQYVQSNRGAAEKMVALINRYTTW